MSAHEPTSGDAESIAILIGRLSHQDMVRILSNLVWEAFGDTDDNHNPMIYPDRVPDKDEVGGLIEGLRQAIFPPRLDPVPDPPADGGADYNVFG